MILFKVWNLVHRAGVSSETTKLKKAVVCHLNKLAACLQSWLFHYRSPRRSTPWREALLGRTLAYWWLPIWLFGVVRGKFNLFDPSNSFISNEKNSLFLWLQFLNFSSFYKSILIFIVHEWWKTSMAKQKHYRESFQTSKTIFTLKNGHFWPKIHFDLTVCSWGIAVGNPKLISGNFLYLVTSKFSKFYIS